MFTLAIETSSKSGTVALLQGDDVAHQRQLDPLVGSARTLAPAIEQLLTDQQLRPDQLNLIAVSTGPGSFTGLRVGITTAKTLAYALGCDILGVDTLDAIAAQVPGDVAGAVAGDGARELHAVIDAQRRELFLAWYERTGETDATSCSQGPPWEHTNPRLRLGGTGECSTSSPLPGEAEPRDIAFPGGAWQRVSWKRLGETQIVAAHAWLGQLAPGTIVSGPALQRLLGQLPPSVVAAPEECWTPQAVTIGRLALVAWRSGRRDDLYQIMPTYLRPSYADEKAPSPKSPTLNPEPRLP
ncbi:MAG TPA: tRNA (adenosine(37)-N6)-threonylcarbamoyltransferase complex dimerization subunit type 1 TsaB [Pirellulaceae bacterium]|nr:tRNA (adenosine(37)-N6)-threonylcarbamoyltransferase complex dimerization subunit type 1 TsaB [Pirellulaceae bacterium]